MRKQIRRMFAFGLSLALVILSTHASAAQGKKIRLAFSALAYANPPFWIAHDLKLFEKYGLESEIVYVGGSRPVQAMLGGSIDVSQVGGAAAVSAAAQGAEIAILGTVFSRLTFAIHANPQIKQVADLKGKTLADGRRRRQQLFRRAGFYQAFRLGGQSRYWCDVGGRLAGSFGRADNRENFKPEC